MKKSMIEVAYQVLTNNDGAMPFVDLWKDVSQEMGFSQTQFEDNIAQFYTDLSLDGRFLNMSQNTWDLRSRHTYSESVMDTDSIAIDEDDEDEEDSDDEPACKFNPCHAVMAFQPFLSPLYSKSPFCSSSAQRPPSAARLISSKKMPISLSLMR